MAKTEKLQPIHPGEILREDFMVPLGLSMNKLALDLNVPVTRIAEIVHERRSITPDTAMRLARYFNTSARFWLNAQAAHDLEVAEDELQRTIERDVHPLAGSTQASRTRSCHEHSGKIGAGQDFILSRYRRWLRLSHFNK